MAVKRNDDREKARESRRTLMKGDSLPLYVAVVNDVGG
jgi:hypothetical protein